MMKINSSETKWVFLSTVGIRAINMVCSFVTGVILARALGASDRGRLAIILTIASCLVFCLSWWGPSMTILVGEDSKRLKTLTWHSFITCVPSFIIVLILFGIVGAPYSCFFKKCLINGSGEMMFVFLIFLSQLIMGSVTSLICGRRKFYSLNFIALASGLFSLFSTYFLVEYKHLMLNGAYLAVFATTLLTSILLIFRLRRDAEWVVGGAVFSKILFFKGFLIGVRGTISNLPRFLLRRADLFWVQYYLSSREVGIYFVAVGIVELAMVAGDVLSSIAFAKSVGCHERSPVVKSSFFSAFVALLFVAFTFVCGKYFFTKVYGPDFASSAMPCFVRMIGVCFYNFSAPMSGFLCGNEVYPSKLIYSNYFSFFANMILDWQMIPVWGVTGAAYASCLANILWAFLVVLKFMHKNNAPSLVREDKNIETQGVGEVI